MFSVLLQRGLEGQLQIELFVDEVGAIPLRIKKLLDIFFTEEQN
jgi:hypothetical protein